MVIEMNYVSTRSEGIKVTGAQAIKQGLAPDGGLFMPDELPFISDSLLHKLCSCSYPRRAAEILSLYLGDEYSYDELLSYAEAAYSPSSFPGASPAPVAPLGQRIRVLELWHGPTAAFKDMALQIMPRLLSGALKKTGEDRQALILVATSGDTGKAALEGYRDVDGIKIAVYYPAHGVSRVQKLQMATQEGSNVFVQSVNGNFDDAQTGVKAIFSDPDMAEKLDKAGYFLSSANSINWGRLVPQIVYYISAYCDMIVSGDISFGEEINVCVPTGNFGNILAAYIAKEMGLPISRLVCASNRNNVLTDFISTGVYDKKREFFTTTSPSMDILISSNLERLLYIKGGHEKTAKYMEELSTYGHYTADEAVIRSISRNFHGDWCSEEECAATIKEVYGKYNYLCDPHTAVGLYCGKRFLEHFDANRRLLCVSTASPYKFAPAVLRALGGSVPENELESMEALSALTGTPVPEQLGAVTKKAVRFDPENAIAPEKMPQTVLGFVKA